MRRTSVKRRRANVDIVGVSVDVEGLCAIDAVEVSSISSLGRFFAVESMITGSGSVVEVDIRASSVGGTCDT